MSYATTGLVYGRDRAHLPAVLTALRAVPGCQAEPEDHGEGWAVRCTFAGLETREQTWESMQLAVRAANAARDACRDAEVP